MGIDGTNYITIIGPSIVIDGIENGGLILNDAELNAELNTELNDDLKNLMEYMIGIDTSMVVKRGPISLKPTGEKTSNNLTIIIRGKSDVNHYLNILMKKYPQCYFKNEYSTDEGYCSMWISYNDNIQHIEWNDICQDELFELCINNII
jgi:hypothetical protein